MNQTPKALHLFFSVSPPCPATTQVPGGVSQSIRDHNVEHREDIGGIWALGFFANLIHFLPRKRETAREKEGDELVSAV